MGLKSERHNTPVYYGAAMANQESGHAADANAAMHLYLELAPTDDSFPHSAASLIREWASEVSGLEL